MSENAALLLLQRRKEQEEQEEEEQPRAQRGGETGIWKSTVNSCEKGQNIDKSIFSIENWR